MSTMLDRTTLQPQPSPAEQRRNEPREFIERPPGFGRYPWWTSLVALAAGLALLALPILGLEAAGYFPFAATLGEGLFVAMLLGVSFVLMSRTRGRPGAADLGLRSTPARAAVGWILVARITVGIATGIYVAAVKHVTPNAPMGPITGVGTLAAIDMVIAACILAPLGEELFFRGFMYASLRGKLPVFWAALVTGGLFGAVHPVYGGTAWNLVPVLAIAGFGMCLLYERTGSLWPAIGFHATMNIGVIYIVTGAAWLPLAITGGAGLLFLIAPWRVVSRRREHRT